MPQKFLKPGKVVIILNGRYAGKKAVILHNFDNGTDDRQYGHAIVAGVDRSPKRVTPRMSERKIHHKTKIKPFTKIVNYNHMMPTRYHLDTSKDDIVTQLRGIVKVESLDKSKRKASRQQVKKIFEKRYRAGQNRWFFSKLRF